jgi:hypothetical protein
MRRALIGVLAALPFALGAGIAQADGSGDWGGGGSGTSSGQVVAVAGTVVSVNPSAGTFVANAFVPTGEGDGFGDTAGSGSADTGGSETNDGDANDGNSTTNGNGNGNSDGNGHGSGNGNFSGDWTSPSTGAATTPGTTTTPAMTQVTIPTNSATTFRVDGQDGAISDLAPGDRFVALFNGAPGDSLQTLVSSPALEVFAHSAPAIRQLFAFVGTVSAVNAAANTVTVQVANTIPSGLVPAGSNPATFTVSADTMFLGGSAATGLVGGSLTDVKAGDVVAGALIGSAGDTLTTVESSPLAVLVDFPATPTSTATSSIRKQVRARALTQALALFGYKSSAKKSHTKHHRGRSGKSHTKKHKAHA